MSFRPVRKIAGIGNVFKAEILFVSRTNPWTPVRLADLPQIVDVTPQLDKAFTPALIGPGGTSTVTLTVTNTDDVKAKSDWSITDTLPAGLVVAGTPNIGGTCVQAAGTAPFVKTAVAGGNSISVTGGDLTAGMESCTITVDVTSDTEGTYVNGPGNIVTNLNPPADATLIVRAPRITLSKALDAPRLSDADQFTMEIRSGSATGQVVSNPANSTTTSNEGNNDTTSLDKDIITIVHAEFEVE